MRTELQDVLDEYNEKVPGVYNSYSYLGTEFSYSPMHYEDGALLSANFLHAGAPKWWQIVPLSEHKKFEE
jgi:hypothetical protein